MNNIDFSHSGGFPLETDTLDFLQNSYTNPIKALTKLGGDNYIISGVEDDGARTTDGWVVIKGDIMPFKGDLKQNTIVVVDSVQTVDFENGAEREAYFTRYATFGVSLQAIPFASLARMNDLQQQKKYAEDLRSDHEAHKVHVTKRTGELQAAHEAHKEHVVKCTGELQLAHDSLRSRTASLERNHQFVRGMIMAWSGSISSIPYGWQLCEALKDRFILGAGGSYGVGATGGEKEHTLTVEEMPSHYHGANFEAGRGDGLKASGGTAVDRYGDRQFQNQNAHEWTKPVGGSRPHNNMPPYYALAYIEYVGFDTNY
ncbi:MAG: hypothetical protein E6Q66_01200 [Pedobacter sp.]|nr:MAG: hypothetical protein E6Q66_01200 [Pedobacter sp.]